jgi:hypothetical protein
MTASLSGVVTAIIPGDVVPDLVAARCGPQTPQAIVRSSGTTGTLRSEVCTGPVTWSEEHCTLILRTRSDGLLTVAFVRLGVMVIEAEGGNTRH